MEIFLNPNVGYLILMLGLVLAILALFAPGTGILEIGALGLLAFAAFILANSLVNFWAEVVIVLGLVLYGVAVRLSKGRLSVFFLFVSMVMLIVGSIFVFRTPTGEPAINPWLAIVVTGGVAALMYVISKKSLEAASRKPVHNPDQIVGVIGVARSNLQPDGTVYVGGEEWSAVGKESIPSGTRVKVVGRRGLLLEVEKVEKVKKEE